MKNKEEEVVEAQMKKEKDQVTSVEDVKEQGACQETARKAASSDQKPSLLETPKV